MKREKKEYRQLAADVLKRASKEQSALMRAQWEILAATYVQLADQSKKNDDTGNSYDPLDPTRTVWPSSST